MESSLRHILHSSNHPIPTLVDHSPPNANGDADTTVANASRKRPASRVKSSYPRKRAIHACRNCRIRRTKCDNERPACSSCIDLGAECIYSDADPSTCVLSRGRTPNITFDYDADMDCGPEALIRRAWPSSRDSTPSRNCYEPGTPAPESSPSTKQTTPKRRFYF
jgi:hypothetical protein